MQEKLDTIHSLVKDIWGKKHTNRGYNWIVPKFGAVQRAHENTLDQIIGCLESKKSQQECPFHARVHTQTKGTKLRGVDSVGIAEKV